MLHFFNGLSVSLLKLFYFPHPSSNDFLGDCWVPGLWLGQWWASAEEKCGSLHRSSRWAELLATGEWGKAGKCPSWPCYLFPQSIPCCSQIRSVIMWMWGAWTASSGTSRSVPTTLRWVSMCPTWSWDRHLLSIRLGCSGSATCGLLCSKVLSFSNQDQVVLKRAGRDGQSCPPWPGVRDENGESRKSWGRSLLALLGQQETGKKKKKGRKQQMCSLCLCSLDCSSNRNALWSFWG